MELFGAGPAEVHLSRYYNSRWQSFDVKKVTDAGSLRTNSEQQWILTSNQSANLHTPIWVVGIDARHALILLPDQILEFEAFGKTTSVVLSSRDTGLGSFTSMRRESMGSIWITGQKGLGRLSPPDWNWRECVKPPAGYTEFREPTEGEGGEVFLSATDESSRPVVLRVEHPRWNLVYQAQSPDVRGWRGGRKKTVWIQDGNQIKHLTGPGEGDRC